jgi:Recombination endonuclease VII
MLPTPTKKCGGIGKFKCGRVLPLTQEYFPWNSRKDRNGDRAFKSMCKLCNNNYSKDFNNRNPESRRRTRVKYYYDLSEETFLEMEKESGGICKLCKLPEVRKTNSGSKICRLMIDHDHRTNRVRGLICHRCNVLIGCLEKESPLSIVERILLISKHIGVYDEFVASTNSKD